MFEVNIKNLSPLSTNLFAFLGVSLLVNKELMSISILHDRIEFGFGGTTFVSRNIDLNRYHLVTFSQMEVDGHFTAVISIDNEIMYRTADTVPFRQYSNVLLYASHPCPSAVAEISIQNTHFYAPSLLCGKL